MGRSTTALLRRIEREDQARIAAQYAERLEASRTGTRAKGLPRWAVDQLLEFGVITPTQHSAAHRYRKAIERSQEGGRSDTPKVDGSRSDPHARAWDRAVSRTISRSARAWVGKNLRRYPAALRVLDRLFAFNGDTLTGALPSLSKMRDIGENGRLGNKENERRCFRVLESLTIYWAEMDRQYGREAGLSR